MAVKLVDLADKLGVKVADIRDYIDFLDLDIPKSAMEVTEANAKILEEAVHKDGGGEQEEEQEKDDDREEEEIQQEDGQEEQDGQPEVSEGPQNKIEEFEEAFVEGMEREIKDQQRKSTAGKKEGKKKVKKKDELAKDTGVEEATLRTDTGILELPEVISVNEFAQRSGIPVARVIGELMKNGILATINQQIDFDTAAIIAQDFHVKVTKKREQASIEDIMGGDLSSFVGEDDQDHLSERPPVVVVMGHVDHGKTQILDTIRHSDVVSEESGGITQHIGAYQITHKGKRITFIDTPGHESFSAMRARGSRVTDIAILVVAADEGVKPQTEEAFHHAKEAGVPIIVAINKIDKENADVNKVKADLGQRLELQLEEWGGDVPVVAVSALKGTNIDVLLDTIQAVAEVKNLKANPNREAVGTVIESHLDKSLGPIATVIVSTGTLQVMDNVVVGGAFGRVKKMMDHKGKTLKAVGPSGPVLIAGLSEVPMAGDLLIVAKDDKTVRSLAQKIASKRRLIAHANSFVELVTRIKEGKLKTLKIIVKADTKGTLEAIHHSISKLESNEVNARVIHSGIGNVTSNDVNMAAMSAAVIFAFHVETPTTVKKQADQLGVEIRHQRIIYKMLEEIHLILEGLLDPEILEVEIGEAQVLQIFFSKKKEMILGCKVDKGKMENKVALRVIRGDQLVGEGKITSLQKGQDQVKEMAVGHECGIRYEGAFKVEVGDTLQSYRVEKRKRTL
ncbi:MAG: translation initiation factor IF-2 [bacterium]|nr:translation initiation factor IF-2 [bacterium]